jgi:hypothetical protein
MRTEWNGFRIGDVIKYRKCYTDDTKSRFPSPEDCWGKLGVTDRDIITKPFDIAEPEHMTVYKLEYMRHVVKQGEAVIVGWGLRVMSDYHYEPYKPEESNWTGTLEAEQAHADGKREYVLFCKDRPTQRKHFLVRLCDVQQEASK